MRRNPDLRVVAKARPGAMPLPAMRDVSALSPAKVNERYGIEAAGVRAVSQGDNVITMFDSIGYDWWTDSGVTAKKVAAQLRAIGDRPVEVQINSPGGDMFEGIAIYNVLREHPQPVTVKVVGMAASAASIIAMAGDTIEIGAAAFLMIHNCWVIAAGNRHDMVDTAKFLEPFDQAMVDVYSARSGQSAKDVAAWMDAETWMSGQLAVDRGFADALLPSDKITTDAKAQAAARAVVPLRAMELSLCASGYTRSEARELINQVKGTPGAAVETPTPGAGDWLGDAQRLIEAFKS